MRTTAKTLGDINIHSALKNIRTAREAFKCFFYKREEIVDLLFLSCCSQTPLLLVGPPGTAKSDIISKFSETLNLEDGQYFEYMLTKFSEPGEIFGAIDITKLKDGIHSRKTQGMLPTALIAFLDEIFKGNSAILNSLLTIVNEKKFYQEGVPTPVPLKFLIAATNEIPDDDSMKALVDRFPLKVNSNYVSDTEDDLRNLANVALKFKKLKYENKKPWKDISLSMKDFDDVFSYVQLTIANGDSKVDVNSFIEPNAFKLIFSIFKTLENDKIEISDRKKVQMFELIRVNALLNHGGKVKIDDLNVLAYLGNRKEEIPVVRSRVLQLLKDTNRS
jgi:MoxR-like ATPase